MDYSPLDAFWKKRGYEKQSSMRALYHWQDIDQPESTAKPMVFWLKRWH
jgi:hypothetical protein